MRENLAAKSFALALILNWLEIICKVLRGNLHPLLEGGGGTQRGYKPGGYLTDWLMRLGVHFFYLQVCANGG
jgi:hypothetical protein